jgi:3-isopropylmalate/(R)-2-methylmalate dehydratase large subunit
VAHRSNIATPDHNVPTTPERKGGIEAIVDQVSRLQVQTLDDNCDEYGIVEFKMNDVRQGIVHVIGPEQGATLPGMTVVCGDFTSPTAPSVPWPTASAPPRSSTCSPPSAWSPRK